MKKLSVPTVNFATALAETISGIGDLAKRALHASAFVNPGTIETNYAVHAKSATLYALPRVTSAADPIIQGSLRKSDLTQLYTQYFVPQKKPARRLYESIKVTANGKCPLCGGVGHVRTLDHYLPKANFPLYSVLPTNLVPCCRDCNSEKLNAFATVRECQTLHPYFDDDKFFIEKWVYCRVIPNDPPVLEYFVLPPNHWHEDDKSRAKSHFAEYRLADKFSVEAAADLPETIQIRRTIMFDVSDAYFSRYLAEKAGTLSLPINNWRRVMFAALAADPWFYSQKFI